MEDGEWVEGKDRFKEGEIGRPRQPLEPFQ